MRCCIGWCTEKKLSRYLQQRSPTAIYDNSICWHWLAGLNSRMECRARRRDLTFYTHCSIAQISFAMDSSRSSFRRRRRTQSQQVERVAQTLRNWEAAAVEPKAITKSQRRKMKDVQDELNELRLSVCTAEQAAVFLQEARKAATAVRAACQGNS